MKPQDFTKHTIGEELLEESSSSKKIEQGGSIPGKIEETSPLKGDFVDLGQVGKGDPSLPPIKPIVDGVDKLLNNKKIKHEIEHAVNYEKYLPEQYLNEHDSKIKSVIKTALRRNEVKFARTLISELRAHGRRKSFVLELVGLLSAYEKESSTQESTPNVGKASYGNAKYLATLTKEQLLQIGQNMGLYVDINKSIVQIASSIAQYHNIHQSSKEF